MIVKRAAAERGHAQHGWLDSWHSFSFADYHDARHMGFGPLRVINEDRIDPGSGFGTHGHADMEIVSYVLSGALAHKDSMGNVAVIKPGEVQRMSAGTGVRHSEYNAADGQQTHFLQIWIIPEARGIAPGYEQKTYADAEKRGRLRLVASRDGAQGSVTIDQDAKLYAGLFDADEHASLALDLDRLTYVHVVRGNVTVNGEPLGAGDALKLEKESALSITRGTGAEVLVFDLPRV